MRPGVYAGFYSVRELTVAQIVESPIHTADADATQLDSCVASASVVCIGQKMLTVNYPWLFSTTRTTHYIDYYLNRQRTTAA